MPAAEYVIVLALVKASSDAAPVPVQVEKVGEMPENISELLLPWVHLVVQVSTVVPPVIVTVPLFVTLFVTTTVPKVIMPERTLVLMLKVVAPVPLLNDPPASTVIPPRKVLAVLMVFVQMPVLLIVTRPSYLFTLAVLVIWSSVPKTFVAPVTIRVILAIFKVPEVTVNVPPIVTAVFAV